MGYLQDSGRWCIHHEPDHPQEQPQDHPGRRAILLHLQGRQWEVSKLLLLPEVHDAHLPPPGSHGPDTIIARTALLPEGRQKFNVGAEIYGKTKMSWEPKIAETFETLPPS